MKLTPWQTRREGWLDPFQSLEQMQREMNRMFENFPRPEKGVQMYLPAIDISEDDNEIIVTADLPGMKKENIEISVEDDVLTIKGFKEETKEEKDKNHVLTERLIGNFNRSLVLPAMVDSQKVKASYKEGTLEIILPKKEEAKKEIKIKVD